jgi:hypothetical protein
MYIGFPISLITTVINIMARTNTNSGGPSSVVESLNGLTGAVTLSAGNNVTLNESGNDIEITANFTQEGKYMISGGITWSGTGLTYDVSFLNYFFNGNKTANPIQVTLAASDPTDNRFDAIVVDEAGTVTTITGTPSANPEVPPIPEDQLQVTIILVAAGSTTPTIASEEIYMDDPTTDWTFSTYTTGAPTGSINFAGTSSPKQGTECIEASTDARLGARFVRGTSFDAFQYTMLQVWVRFTGTAVATNKALNVRFENSAGSLVANTVNLFNYGLQRGVLNTWQLVVVPITAFGALPATVKGLKIIMAGGTVGQARQWDLDYMILTNGSVPYANVPTIAFYKDDVGIASQSGINLIEGTGVTIDAVNNPLYNRVDYTINSSGGGGSSFITKTKAEIDALITANELVAGALYEITGVHPTLYDDGTTSGTTIYLRAISGNQLEVQGMGKFYNPKYNQAVDGFDIWDNKMYGTLSTVVGVFDFLNKELVTANNGATGLILADGMIQWLSGDWSTATSIEGDVSGATADVVDFVTPSYSIGDKVIWGGYSWTNVNGNVGTSTDVLNLDSEWSKNPYDTTNYNVAYDVIEYDYANDFIVRRYNKEANIDVKCSKPQYDFFVGINGFSFHAISVQQWGNNYDLLTYKGQLNIICNGGYNESVNFSGSAQGNLTFGNNSYQYNLTFGNSSGQYNLTFGSGSYQDNLTFGSSSYQQNLTFGSWSSQDNLTFGSGSYQHNLTFGNDSYQYNLTFGSDSYQDNLTFGISSYQQNLTFGSGSSQDNLTFGDGSSQQNLTFGSSSFQSSLTFGSGSQLNYSSQVISSNMQYITFNTKGATVPDLSSATLIFDGNVKEVYQRPDDALKIRYYDNSDALVIADIAD